MRSKGIIPSWLPLCEIGYLGGKAFFLPLHHPPAALYQPRGRGRPTPPLGPMNPRVRPRLLFFLCSRMMKNSKKSEFCNHRLSSSSSPQIFRNFAGDAYARQTEKKRFQKQKRGGGRILMFSDIRAPCGPVFRPRSSCCLRGPPRRTIHFSSSSDPRLRFIGTYIKIRSQNPQTKMIQIRDPNTGHLTRIQMQMHEDS